MAQCISCGFFGILVGNKKICSNCNLQRRKNSQKGFLKGLLTNAKNNSKNRKKECSFSITYDDILSIYNDQNGLCFYSKIPMVTHQNSDWQCSLERKNPSCGYVVDNVVLCCAEFNNKVQLSTLKFNSLLNLHFMPFKEYVHYEFELECWGPQKRLKIDIKVIDKTEYFSCNIK